MLLTCYKWPVNKVWDKYMRYDAVNNVRMLGERISKIRLSHNLTQADLSKSAGTSLRTIKRLEAGENSSLETFVKVLGALGLENTLLSMLPDPSIRPIERVKMKGHERKRASSSRKIVNSSQWAWENEAKE